MERDCAVWLRGQGWRDMRHYPCVEPASCAVHVLYLEHSPKGQIWDTELFKSACAHHLGATLGPCPAQLVLPRTRYYWLLDSWFCPTCRKSLLQQWIPAAAWRTFSGRYSRKRSWRLTAKVLEGNFRNVPYFNCDDGYKDVNNCSKLRIFCLKLVNFIFQKSWLEQLPIMEGDVQYSLNSVICSSKWSESALNKPSA